MKKIVVFILLVVAMFCPPAAHSQDRIRAVGTATIYNNAVDAAREKALDNAQRKAVEEKVGVMITSVTEVENFELKMDQILSESRGFISNYKVASEERQGSIYKVTIDAAVETGRLKDRMEAIRLVMERKSKPRIMFVLNGRETHHALAEATMTRYFISQGFKMVDPSASQKASGTYSTLETDKKALSNLARRYGAEIVVLVHVEDKEKAFKMGDIEVKSHDVSIAGKVLNGDTGEIIVTVSKAEKGDFKKAVEDAATKAARQMRDEILERWSSELANTSTIKLHISGLQHEDLSLLKDALKQQIKGLRQIYQRSYTRGTAELDLEMRGNTQGLADELAGIRIQGKKVRILETTANRIEVDLKSK